MRKNKLFKKLKAEVGWRQLSHLSEKTNLSRQTLYNMFEKQNPRLDSFLQVVDALDFNLSFERRTRPSLFDVLSSLKKLGAPVLMQNLSETALSLEETLAYATVYSREDGLTSSVLPYVLSKVSNSVNVVDLFSQLKALGECRAFGYLSELAYLHSHEPRLKMFYELLFDHSFPQETFYRDEKLSVQLLEVFSHVKNDPAKKWKFVLTEDLESHLDRYKKWDRQKEENNERKVRHPKAPD